MAEDARIIAARGVREVREHLGLSQSSLARIMGVSLRTVRRWEREGLPDRRTLLALERLVAQAE